jgi:hypothetical protein
VTFDPFGDFETRGYLRNLANEKDPEIVRRLEHTSFTTGIDAAFARLAPIKRLSYRDVLKPFVRDAIADDRLAAKIAQAPGLDGNAEQNEVLGRTNEPALQARYEQQELKRKGIR